MSLNPDETGPIVFFDAADLAPERCFAAVLSPEGSFDGVPAGRLLLSVGLEDLQDDACTKPFARFRPSGVLLSGCRTRADVQAADVALGVIEAETGHTEGDLAIVAVFGADPASFLGAERLAGASRRLIALVLDEDALAAAIGLMSQAARSLSPAIQLARGAMILRAADAGLPCFWSLPSGETDGHALLRLRDAALQSGFRDVVVRTAGHRIVLGRADAMD
jgi:citrate lyase beta subunit